MKDQVIQDHALRNRFAFLFNLFRCGDETDEEHDDGAGHHQNRDRRIIEDLAIDGFDHVQAQFGAWSTE